jgi:hypothetical protein
MTICYAASVRLEREVASRLVFNRTSKQQRQILSRTHFIGHLRRPFGQAAVTYFFF